MTNVKVEAIAHADVKGKLQYYIKFTHQDGTAPVLINVGQKTYESVRELLERTEHQLLTKTQQEVSKDLKDQVDKQKIK